MSKREKYSKSTFKLLFKLAYKIKFELLVGIIFSTIYTVLNIFAPIVLKNIIDKEIDAIIGIINIKSFLLMSALYLFVSIMSGVMEFIHVKHYKKTSNKAGFILRDNLFGHIMDLPLSFFDKTAVGKITSRITSDVNELKQLFYLGLTTVFNSLLFLIGSIIYITFTVPETLYIVLIPIPVFIIIIFSYNKYQSSINIKYRKIKSTITANLNEIIKGTNIIKAYAVIDPVESEFIKDNEKAYKFGKKIEFFDSFFSYNITDMLRLLSTIAILYFAGISYLNGDKDFTVGYILILVQYTSLIYDYLTRVMNRLNIFEKGMSSLEHINQILEENVEKDGIIEVENIVGNVEFKNVTHEYVENNPILKNINFKRKSGTSTALVGNTGSGKSSIITLLFKFYLPKGGEILIDGININEIKTSSMRKNMAMILQDPVLFKGSLRYNIALGENYSDDEIKDALITSGGKNILKKLKHGLDTNLLGENGGLSLGEKQIINFARTIIRDPKILVLDEATASIDTETEHYIQEGLNALMKGRTSFIVAHRLSTIQNCDYIIVLQKGEIVECGTHDELIKLGKEYYKLAKGV